MPNALGPVVGNRIADAHKATLKPHLRERLALQASRSTPVGTIATAADGRQSFVPGYLAPQHKAATPAAPVTESHAFLPGACVRVVATLEQLVQYDCEPFPVLAAGYVMNREGRVVAHVLYALLGLVAVELDGLIWGFRPEHLAQVALPAGAAGGFDPYTEPLALGDTVQGMDGRVGRVTLVEPQRLGVAFERGSAWCGPMNWRGSFRLLAKAGAWECPDSCPF
ncbi:hypothetical protein [Azohydromonas australica]|uniref:hypothetical protein n=1 Tax=Azohydromonas australica TaxID=364039 RepID=UPI000405652B|nr:hypothetical protein [Azohydromonas australica]